MAKNKSTKAASPKASKTAKEEKPESNRRFEPDAAAARNPGVMSTTEIGHVAGDVWGVLSRDGALTVAAIKKTVVAPPDLVLAAIGWLAREDKLEFTTHGRSVTVSLR